jgi:4-hydroxy-3-polyprenylbenzoate decarboxylase
MRFIVALTGASGQLYGLRLLQKLLASGADVSLVLSEAAGVSLAAETGIKLNAHAPDLKRLLEGARVEPSEEVLARLRYENPRDIGARAASGSARHDGMIVAPCSMASLARIAHGLADDLIARAADVTLKERRPLILVTREMPLSLIHLRNMALATEAGALIMHACPHFYHRPQTVQEVVDTVVDRVLDQLGIEIQTQRWREDEMESPLE